MNVDFATRLTTLRAAIQGLHGRSRGQRGLINIGIGPICKAGKRFCKVLVPYGLGCPFLSRHGDVDLSLARTCHWPVLELTGNNALSNATLSTPVRKHSRHLSGVTECLHAEVRILQHENTELKQFLGKHKERMSGKRLVLKGKVIASTEEVQQKLAEAERVCYQSVRYRLRGSNGPRRFRNLVHCRLSMSASVQETMWAIYNRDY